MFYNFKIYILYIIVIITTLSCGPRSGIHKDESNLSSENKPNESQFVCGNAVQEEINTDWANKTLGLYGDSNKGYKLFKQNCAVCHTLTDLKLTGSGLHGVYDRVPEPKIEWLKKYILNSEKVYKSGDQYARKLHKQSGGALMTNFDEYLTDQEVKDLLIYVLSNTR